MLSVTYVCIQIYKYSLKNSFLNLHQTDRFILFFDQHNINIDFAFIKIEIDSLKFLLSISFYFKFACKLLSRCTTPMYQFLLFFFLRLHGKIKGTFYVNVMKIINSINVFGHRWSRRSWNALNKVTVQFMLYKRADTRLYTRTRMQIGLLSSKLVYISFTITKQRGIAGRSVS